MSDLDTTVLIVGGGPVGLLGTRPSRTDFELVTGAGEPMVRRRFRPS